MSQDRRSRRGLRSVAVLLVLAAMSGCVSEANQTVVEKAKEQSKNEPWYDHVEEWGTNDTIEIKTDFAVDEIDSYLPAHEICAVIVSNFAKDATDLPNVQIFGERTKTTTKVDGSTKTRTSEEVLAQSANTTDHKCGINPPFSDRDLYREAEKLGVRVNS